jgi:ABC-type Na+ transport system ATPase subunit NatA
MEEPVVVKPEVDSKNALINDGIVLLNRYGIDPSDARISHDKVTARKPSLVLTFVTSHFLEMIKNMVDNIIVIKPDQIKGKGDSLYIYATGRHIRKETVSITRIVLRSLSIINGFISLIHP